MNLFGWHTLSNYPPPPVLPRVFVKMEDDGELPKTLVKLRRTPSDTPRPASTPPVIAASAIKDEDEEEKIIAELEVRLSVTDQQIQPVTHVINICATFCQTWKIFQRTPLSKGDGVAAVTAGTSRSRDRKVTFAVACNNCPLFCFCQRFSSSSAFTNTNDSDFNFKSDCGEKKKKPQIKVSGFHCRKWTEELSNRFIFIKPNKVRTDCQT